MQTVLSVPGNNWAGTWNDDGTIVFGSASTKGLQRVSADGGALSQVTTLDAPTKETAHLWPQFLPDGRHFLYLALGRIVRRRARGLCGLDRIERAQAGGEHGVHGGLRSSRSTSSSYEKAR